MGNLSTILFIFGASAMLISLLTLLFGLKKSSKMSMGVISLILIGFISMAAGLVSMVPNLKGKIINVVSKHGLEVTSKVEGSSKDKSEGQVSNDNSSKTINGFTPTKLKYPIITTTDIDKIYKDADGTIYENQTMINPNGVKMGTIASIDGVVAFPIKNPNHDGFVYYHGYHYGYQSEISEGIFKYETRDSAVPSQKDYISKKTELYDYLDLQTYDFIYKYMPVQHPNKNKIVQVPLLNGIWVAYKESLLNGSGVAAKMSFSKDGSLIMENNIVNANEIPSMIHYELEKLDTNAYKLYLYSETVKADSNGGGTSISDEPVKRNFIIYITSKNTFELVYYDNKLVRNSITMKRE